MSDEEKASPEDIDPTTLDSLFYGWIFRDVSQYISFFFLQPV